LPQKPRHSQRGPGGLDPPKGVEKCKTVLAVIMSESLMSSNCECECDSIDLCGAEMTSDRPMQICGYQVCFFQTLKYSKTRFPPRLRPGPRWGAYDAPPDPLVGSAGEEDTSSPYPYPLDDFGVSISAPSAPRLSGPMTTNSWLRL